MRKFVFICLLFSCLVHVRSRKHSVKRKLSAMKKSSVDKIANTLHSKEKLVDLKNDSTTATKKSYTVDPKMYSNYVDQFDKIKSLGEKVKCKLHGTCANDLKRHEIRHDVMHHGSFHHAKHGRGIVDKKSMQSFSDVNIPDNSNQFIQPPPSPISPQMMQQALTPPGAGPDAAGMAGGPDASAYSDQPNAAGFGQQPQMNLKLPKMAESAGMSPEGIPSLDQMQNAANDASIQSSIQNKMKFMDSANEGMVQMPPDQMPPGMPGAPIQPGMGPGGFPGGEMGPGRPGGGSPHPAFARHHGSPHKGRHFSDEHHGGDVVGDEGRKEEEDSEHIRVDGGPRGVPNGESASVSDEDIYKAEGVQPNEMKDLHNFLSHNRKSPKGESEEEESERENEEFEENERRHGENVSHEGRGGPYQDQDEREEGHDTRSHQDGTEGEEGEHGRIPNEQEEYEEETKQKPHSNHNQVVPPGHGVPNEAMGPMGEMGPGVPGSPVAPGMPMEPGAEMEPGRPGLKPGTPEVPTLNNLMGGGGMPLQILQDQSMAETGPGGRPNVDFDSQGRFVQDNNRNMMESNSDYDVPKTGRRNSFLKNHTHEEDDEDNIHENDGDNMHENDGDSMHADDGDNDEGGDIDYGDKEDESRGNDEYDGDDDERNMKKAHVHGEHDDVMSTKRNHRDRGKGNEVESHHLGDQQRHISPNNGDKRSSNDGDDNEEVLFNGKKLNGMGSVTEDKIFVPDGKPLHGKLADPTVSFMDTMHEYEAKPQLHARSFLPAFARLWKDYMLTTQSQLADKDPSANNREVIHHPRHTKKSKVKNASKRNIDEDDLPDKRSESPISSTNPITLNNTSTANETAEQPVAGVTNSTSVKLNDTALNADAPVAPDASVRLNDTSLTDVPVAASVRSNDTSVDSETSAPANNTTPTVEITPNNATANTAPETTNNTVAGVLPPDVKLTNTTPVVAVNTTNTTQPSKKSEVKSQLPPIYLTVKNGQKMLVVHPTAEFVNSLPRINFTEDSTGQPDTYKRTLHSSMSNGMVSKVVNEVPRDDEDEEDEEEELEDEVMPHHHYVTENASRRSNIIPGLNGEPRGYYYSAPVNSKNPPDVESADWRRLVRNMIAARNNPRNRMPVNPAAYPDQNPMYESSSPDNFYQKELRLRKSFMKQPESAMPVPKEIQNLYQQYNPGEGKSTFANYAPSQDEVSEELKYVQNGIGNNVNINDQTENNMAGQIGQSPESQIAQESVYNNNPMGGEPDGNPALSNRDAPWEGDTARMGMTSEGNKRSGLPIVLTKEHVGFGPIFVEAKTADAPRDDPMEE